MTCVIDGGSKRTSAFWYILILSLLFLPGMNARAAPTCPPGNLDLYYQLFVNVRSLTSFPFSLFPGIGGADNTKFVMDDLINREELLHTTAYLKGQLAIRILFSPDTVPELQATVNVCDYLLQRLPRVATHRDARGSLAMGEDDVERLFAPPATERGKEITQS
ncbi:MAG TPA: hypothetical protein VFZ34_11140 [Blastocatellia bacterium]|nr:hypothetical protein [Blastocatellia bacterium]